MLSASNHKLLEGTTVIRGVGVLVRAEVDGEDRDGGGSDARDARGFAERARADARQTFARLGGESRN
jgi:hypothetical protein